MYFYFTDCILILPSVFLFRYPRMPEANSLVGIADKSSAVKTNPVISQAFVPTSVLRKLHCDKHDQVCNVINIDVA